MNIRECHSVASEIGKFEIVYSLPNFSLAEYYGKPKEKAIQPFHHVNEDFFEFVIPIKTIPLVFYDNANYICEVGFIYPIRPGIEHGYEVELERTHFYSIVISEKYLNELMAAMNVTDKFFGAHFAYNSSLLEYIDRFKEAFVNKDDSINSQKQTGRGLCLRMCVSNSVT